MTWKVVRPWSASPSSGGPTPKVRLIERGVREKTTATGVKANDDASLVRKNEVPADRERTVPMMIAKVEGLDCPLG